MYLLDTNVLSALRRSRDRTVHAWTNRVPPSDLFVSVVTIGEIELGIEFQRKRNADFARELEGWLDIILGVYGERILPMTVGIARRWGRLAVQTGNKGLDLAIAATALEHGLTIVTRNVSHFEPTGVTVFNPFASA
ncbi:MAG TPA: type II toxin-antitoxin system VapC family toxin [Beijerinckiaceae bacterium]|nr:type II toxin-antitoxin system VapC family toxin [Beijerinckiaceae bacterium]